MIPARPIYLVYHIPKTGGVSLREWLVRHLGMHRGMVHYGVAGELFCMRHGLPYLEALSPDRKRDVRVVIGHYVTKATADLFPDREPRRLVVLRDPVNRLVSQYNHAMGLWCQSAGRPLIEFAEWFETHAVARYDYRDAVRRQGLTPEIAIESQASIGPNFMARFLAQNFGKDHWPTLQPSDFATKINQLLESFWLVGLTERLGSFAATLGNALAIPPDLRHLNRGHKSRVILEPTPSLIAYIRETNPADLRIYEYWKKRLDVAPPPI